jgi:hypothetical protein
MVPSAVARTAHRIKAEQATGGHQESRAGLLGAFDWIWVLEKTTDRCGNNSSPRIDGEFDSITKGFARCALNNNIRCAW